jgi:apolipoprotein N-acyltransferase
MPGERVATLYARTGEVVPLAALAFCAFVIARLLRRRRRR